jgi:hypothetical protein
MPVDALGALLQANSAAEVEIPIILLIAGEGMQHVFQCLVSMFSLTIGL